MPNKVDVAGLRVDALTKSALLSELASRIKQDIPSFIITPYSEFLYRCLHNPELMDILNRADFSVPDGIAIQWAATFLSLAITAKSFPGKVLQAFWQAKYSLAAILLCPGFVRRLIPEKISGADLVWDLVQLADRTGRSIYLLGGFGDTPKIVAEKMHARFPGLKIAGLSHKNPNDTSIVPEIVTAQPDVLFVAFGPIRQEQWILEHRAQLPSVKLFIGLGGTFDYIAGIRSAPPRFVRNIGLEWLYRLFTQGRLQRISQATFGLVLSLIRYKVFMSCPLRPNAALVVLNKQGQILICQRNPHLQDMLTRGELSKDKFVNYWQLSQGGIEPDEPFEVGALRELEEETGIKSAKIIKVSEHMHSYVWNAAIRSLWRDKRHFRGQEQRIVYLQFVNDDSEIHLDQREFVKYKWVDPADLPALVHPERRSLTELVLEDLPQF